MSESNDEYYFKSSDNKIEDFNKVVSKIGSINDYMQKNYKTMDNLLKQPEAIYILSYLSQSHNFRALTNTKDTKDTRDSNNKLLFLNVDGLIESLNNEEEPDEKTKENISKWKKFLNTVPEDFKKLANDLNDVHQGQKNAHEVNYFGDDDVKKLLDQITPKEKSKTLETSAVSPNNLDNSYQQEFKMSGNLVKDFNNMVRSVKNYDYLDANFGKQDSYQLSNIVSYLSQIDNFDAITDENKVSDFFKNPHVCGNLDVETYAQTANNITEWKEFLNAVKKNQPEFLEGCKELNKITNETVNVEEKKSYANPVKTFFRWLFSGAKGSFSDYFKQENNKANKAKENYINAKLDEIKTKKQNLVHLHPLSKILKEAKQKALGEKKEDEKGEKAK